MKIFKYIVFLSILSGIFFVIYRKSDEKSFLRSSISFKIAVLIAASAAGLIPLIPANTEPPGNNNQVIMNKTGDNVPSVTTSPGRGQPSQFPTPPAGGRPSRPSRPVYVPKSRTPPKVVDKGLGAGANPAGAGGGGEAAEFDDQCSLPKKEQSQESKTFDSDYRSKKSKKKKKKKSAEQCELDENVKEKKIEIVYRIKENPVLIREAERAGRDQAAQRSLNNLVEQLSLGNKNPGIGTEKVFNDVYELRGKNRARVYYREVDGKIEILGKSIKINQQKVIDILKTMYN